MGGIKKSPLGLLNSNGASRWLKIESYFSVPVIVVRVNLRSPNIT